MSILSRIGLGYGMNGTMSELQQALLIFTLGGIVTAATILMIVRGHLRWRDRDPYDDPDPRPWPPNRF